jgi:hypothetical protein
MDCIEELLRLMNKGVAEAVTLRRFFFESRDQVLMVPAGEIVINHLRQQAEYVLMGARIDKT